MKIGVFDSGVGGLTVLKELIKYKPNNEYYYVGDTLNMPYGSKSHKELFECASRIIDHLINLGINVIVIACGTISSTIYKQLKEKYNNITFLDVISPTIDFLNNSNYKNIGVIATKNTIESSVFQNNVTSCNIHALALPKLASMIEHESEYKEYLDNELLFFNDKNIQLLVLGCTHYPIIENYFKEKYKTFNMASSLLRYVEDGDFASVNVSFTKLDDCDIKLIKDILGNQDIIVNSITI